MDFNKKIEKILDGNYTRMHRAILNKSWHDHPTNTELCGNIPQYHTLYTKEEFDMLVTAIEVKNKLYPTCILVI